jgi:hypothetical protein
MLPGVIDDYVDAARDDDDGLDSPFCNDFYLVIANIS